MHRLISALVLGCVLLSILVLLVHPSSELQFAVLTIGKNEGMIVDEWIRHYVWQGAERIFYIDNGSTDDTEARLKPWTEKGLVSYHHLPEPNKQKDHYNTVFNQHIRGRVTWLLVVDLDEFAYHRSPGKTLRDFVNPLDPDRVCSVWMRWKVFGSNGHAKQPPSIRKGFTKKQSELAEPGKSIVSVRLTKNITVHDHDHSSGSCQHIKEPPELALNHYQIMSREYFERVKMGRGDVLHPQLTNERDWTYFAAHDRNEVEDNELAELVSP